MKRNSMFVFLAEARRCIVAATVILAAVLVANAAAADTADGGGGHECDQQEGVNAQVRCWQSVEALSKKKKTTRTTLEVRLEKRGLTSKKTAKPIAAPDDQHEDLVQTMPGYDEPTLPTKQYSGYLHPVGECDASINGPECRVHYMLALADIDTGDDNGDDDSSSKYEAAMSAPTVLWMNGGPGASSVAGYYIELGPLLLNATGDGVFENPYSWTKAGVNLLVLESPLGVGYSYCANQFDTAIGKCNNTDVSTAALNRAALVDFFAHKFPQLSDNDFYIIGESYAGVYIPTLAKELLENTDIQLKGIAVGDPCTDNESQQQSMDALWYANKYGLLNSTFYETITSDECKGDYLSMLLPRFNNYAGDSDPTGDPELYDAELPKECILAHRKILMSTSNGLAGRWPERYIAHDSLYGLVEKYQNGKPFEKLSAYMNRPDVRTALNMAESPVKQWFFAGRAGRTMNYRMQYAACTFDRPENEIEFANVSMVDLYREISPHIDKTWIYSGDTDPNVPYEGTRKAIEKIGFAIAPGGDYRAWFFNKDPVRNQQLLVEKPITYGPDLVLQHLNQPQFGGEVVNYEHGLSFVTVHGAGHLVPVSRPDASLHFFKKFVDGSGSSMLSPPFPSDQTLAESSEGDFQEIIANWTIAAKNPPYV